MPDCCAGLLCRSALPDGGQASPHRTARQTAGTPYPRSDLAEVAQIVRSAAREVTGAQGATFVLRDSDNPAGIELPKAVS